MGVVARPVFYMYTYNINYTKLVGIALIIKIIAVLGAVCEL